MSGRKSCLEALTQVFRAGGSGVTKPSPGGGTRNAERKMDPIQGRSNFQKRCGRHAPGAQGTGCSGPARPCAACETWRAAQFSPLDHHLRGRPDVLPAGSGKRRSGHVACRTARLEQFHESRAAAFRPQLREHELQAARHFNERLSHSGERRDGTIKCTEEGLCRAAVGQFAPLSELDKMIQIVAGSIPEAAITN